MDVGIYVYNGDTRIYYFSSEPCLIPLVGDYIKFNYKEYKVVRKVYEFDYERKIILYVDIVWFKMGLIIYDNIL